MRKLAVLTAMLLAGPAAAQIAGLNDHDHPTVCLRGTTGLTFCNDSRGSDAMIDMTSGSNRADQIVGVHKDTPSTPLVPTYRVREGRGRIWYDRHLSVP